jgi:hypothetical protein
VNRVPPAPAIAFNSAAISPEVDPNPMAIDRIPCVARMLAVWVRNAETGSPSKQPVSSPSETTTR